MLQKKFFFVLIGLMQLLVCSTSASEENNDSLFGSRFQTKTRWCGKHLVEPSIEILVLAGHADSQRMEGAGTSGEAVALKGSKPMDPNISDELFWNLQVRDAVTRIGSNRGLNIKSYDPGKRMILDENEYQTNWSTGSRHAFKGGYVIEIHFDAYGRYGFGSGLIPPLTKNLNLLDESLAIEFGRYPLFFRGGLGASRRQIRVLEIGKLEGNLEMSLRNPKSMDTTIKKIANRIVNAIVAGLNKKEVVNQSHLKEHTLLLDSCHETNLEAL